LGKEASIFQPLLAFNLGLEVGQLVIVAIFMVVAGILVGIIGVNKKDWALIISSIIFGMAVMMMIDTKFW
jgi:hypothetical protein